MMGITIMGGFEAIEKLKDDKERVIQGMTKSMQQIGFYVEGKVKESIAGQQAEPPSVDTGRFLNSVTTEISSDMETHVQQAVIFTPLDYPKYLEYGTSRIAARQHFHNTAFREQAKVGEMMNEAVKDALK